MDGPKVASELKVALGVTENNVLMVIFHFLSSNLSFIKLAAREADKFDDREFCRTLFTSWLAEPQRPSLALPVEPTSVSGFSHSCSWVSQHQSRRRQCIACNEPGGFRSMRALDVWSEMSPRKGSSKLLVLLRSKHCVLELQSQRRR